MKLVGPKEPSLVLINLTDGVVRDIKWLTYLWNMSRVDQLNPVPILSQVFDWLPANGESVPLSLFGLPGSIASNGDHLFGSIGVQCPDCTRGHTFIVDIVLGEGGWYGELKDKKDGSAIVPTRFLRGPFLAADKEEYFRAVTALIPERDRTHIAPW